jgi:hypothetical protein
MIARIPRSFSFTDQDEGSENRIQAPVRKEFGRLLGAVELPLDTG